MDNLPELMESHDEPSFEKANRYILMPVDGSENSERAFNWYAENLHKSQDGLYLVHIVEPITSAPAYSFATNKASNVGDDMNRQIAELVEKGRVLGKKYLDMCQKAGIATKFTLHVGSKPGENIIKLVKELDIQIVVMGSRGLGTIKRTFMGSVSDHILHHAGIPTIVVPPPRKK
ncbi:hypothetical protein Ciccas_011369 [Cichlidogyrus casuarinus]|uniref:UspA domain-containing protein n=1 Tax=Cichlidogyrus casuarinus TaxID=1844966 RepID=A0ABD2PW75_9PLAT